MDLANLNSLRKYLKWKIMIDKPQFPEFCAERKQLLSVLRRTVQNAESDSALLVGPQGCGKTYIVNSAIKTLEDEFNSNDLIVVRLNGLIHTNDNLALRSIINQLHLDTLDGDKVSGSFSDNLLFLLQCLQSGGREMSKPVIFLLDEFHHFCEHRNQTLLYNLFNASQSAEAPICVVGVTSRIDVIELLEKRVKSRFSHRQIVLFSRATIESRLAVFRQLLSVTHSSNEMDPIFVHCWNESIMTLSNLAELKKTLKTQLELDSNMKIFQSLLIELVAKLSPEHPCIILEDVVETFEKMYQDDKVNALLSLSVLEMSLIIAMNHHTEVYDGEPLNFEMTFNQYMKIASQNTSTLSIERSVLVKAFERIKQLEFIVPISNALASRSLQKEYQLFHFVLLPEQVKEAVRSYIGLPTDVSRWASSIFVG